MAEEGRTECTIARGKQGSASMGGGVGRGGAVFEQGSEKEAWRTRQKSGLSQCREGPGEGSRGWKAKQHLGEKMCSEGWLIG